jgi:hypothetical protein
MGLRMRLYDAPGLRLSLLALGLALLGTGCPKNVDGAGHSGKDVKYKGAKKIKIEDNEGRSRKDIITYPGGDRVDWKVFEIGTPPADDKKKDDKDAAPPAPDVTGTLKVTLRWKPPRPGLDLAFDVYDQYFHRIGRAKPNKSGAKRSKKVTIKDAGSGKYYVMVYAPRRMDAGTYRVHVKFQPGDGGGPVAAAPTPGDVPDPPTLPALPEATADAGGTTPPGGGTTPPGGGTTPPGGGTTAPPPPPPPPPEVKGRVVKYVVAASGGLIITIDKGKNQGVEPGWKGSVLNASGKPVQGGEFQITKVRGGESEGKVSLSVDQIAANKKVLLSAPSP